MAKGYKKKELKLHKNGYYDLAKAVMTQWQIDGRPRGDEIGVKLWVELIKAHQDRTRTRQGKLHKPTRRYQDE